MKKRFEPLKDLIGTNTPIQVRRKGIDEHSLDGFVVGLSEKLLLLHVINGDDLLLNGYSAIRIQDITSWKIDEGFVTCAMRHYGREPVVPTQIDCDNWSVLLASGQKAYTFVSIETARNESGCCFIGPITKQKSRSITLRHATSKAVWGDEEKFRLRDITKVDLDNGYVNALIEVMREERLV